MPIPLRELYDAWRRARKGKIVSVSQLRFERGWLSQLIELGTTLSSGAWQPRPTACFVVKRPKTREIHAPDFSDRVVHHWLVPQLEAWWEPRFIHDSFANRKDKGTHAAVNRVQDFMRQRVDGMGGGYVLKLDVHNFFNCIGRRVLYRRLCDGLGKSSSGHHLEEPRALTLRKLCHALLTRPPQVMLLKPETHAQVPPHKRLAFAKPGCGLPIGNLTSQFFANVYLDALDQFVKHRLKVRHYVRYVDDFVLLGSSPEQLLEWKAAIEHFLNIELGLRLNNRDVLSPLRDGVDFLGYRVFAHHRAVRSRVVNHLCERLKQWEGQHVRTVRVENRIAWRVHLPPAALADLTAFLASYRGHFSHAQAQTVWLRVLSERRWLLEAGLDQPKRLQLSETYLAQQVPAAQTLFPSAMMLVQTGCRWRVLNHGRECMQIRHEALPSLTRACRQSGSPYLVVNQVGWLRHGLRRRQIVETFLIPGEVLGS